MQAPSCARTGKYQYRPPLGFPLLAFCVLTALGGCEVGPNYKPPELHTPSTWVAPPTTQASITVQEPLQVEQWWTTFNDPQLDSLIRRAVRSNLNLQIAGERIRQARANLGIATAGFFPVVNADGSLSHSFASGSSSGATRTGTV